MKIFIKYTLVLCLLWTMQGCCIHLWPDEAESDGPNTTIRLSLHYNTDLYVWEHLYDPKSGAIREQYPDSDIFPGQPGATSISDPRERSGKVMVSLNVYPRENLSRCIANHTFTYDISAEGYDTEFDLKVPYAEGEEYDIIVWSQLLPDKDADPFYDASNFNRIQLIPANYDGSTNYRDGFRGSVSVKADAASAKYSIEMTRPMGKFELITTDLSEFLERETTRRKLSARASYDEYRVMITFPLYYPSSYSASEDRLENSSNGVGFETKMVLTGTEEASLGFEYVFLNNVDRSSVQMQVSIYDPEGQPVASSSTIKVPMRRDGHTLLRGAFLSEISQGGIGLDPSYNGDHNMFW